MRPLLQHCVIIRDVPHVSVDMKIHLTLKIGKKQTVTAVCERKPSCGNYTLTDVRGRQDETSIYVFGLEDVCIVRMRFSTRFLKDKLSVPDKVEIEPHPATRAGCF